MSHTEIAYAVGDVMVWVTLGLVALFMLVYGVLSPWEKSIGGRHIMAFSAALFLVLLLGVASVQFGPDYAARPYVRAFVFTLLAVEVVHRGVIMFRDQRAHRSPGKEKESTHG